VSSPNPSQGPKILDADFAFGFTDLGSAPPSTLPEIAFAGRSNVGKSSLLNTLLARKNLVRTSSTPGCTRQVNVFAVRLQDAPSLHLADLPGFGYAKRSKSERQQWGTLIERYLRDRAALRLVVILIDARRGPDSLEMDLVQYLAVVRSPAVPHVFVATKLDKLPRASAKPTLDAIRKQIPGHVVGFSAKTGLGRDDLWRVLLRASVTDAPPSDGT
jgi:GTP-binding protein